MTTPTRQMGVGDLSLEEWKILDLRSIGHPDLERHIFGFCKQTGYCQVSSRILEETPAWVRTRSRRYFKDGPPKCGWALKRNFSSSR